jgi:hypothetical protein
MAYTKYSLTPANNTATPPDGAPEGMLPSAVNDTMRDMMAQIRDCGDGVRDGTYTMTAVKITGGTITGATLTGNTFTNPVVTGGTITSPVITGGTITSPVITGATITASGVATFSAGTVALPAITTTGDTNTGIFFPAADTIAFTEGGVESMRIDTSGNLLLGTTSNPLSANFNVYQSDTTWAMGIQNNANDSGLAITNGSGTANYTAIGFFNNGTTFSSCGLISVSGTSTTYATSSDYRLKENIVPITGALAIVSQLKPVTYKWKSDGTDGQGFIAHELQAIVPDCVVGEKDAVDANGKPQYQGVDTSFLVATLTKAIQEQQTLIESLTTRLTALENK